MPQESACEEAHVVTIPPFRNDIRSARRCAALNVAATTGSAIGTRPLPYYASSFPALFDRSSRRFWAETATIVFASSAPDRSNPTSPSALVTLPATATPEQALDTWRESVPGAIVVVAAPVLENSLRPGLAQIRFAAEPGRPLSGVVLARDIPEMTPVRAILLTDVDEKADTLTGFGHAHVAHELLRRGARHVITASTRADPENVEWVDLQRNLGSTGSVALESAATRAPGYPRIVDINL